MKVSVAIRRKLTFRNKRHEKNNWDNFFASFEYSKKLLSNANVVPKFTSPLAKIAKANDKANRPKSSVDNILVNRGRVIRGRIIETAKGIIYIRLSFRSFSVLMSELIIYNFLLYSYLVGKKVNLLNR
tara:strand:- start:59 stop:442 length:384 start_codon:yes stop_codon:yes gene_type:complete